MMLGIVPNTKCVLHDEQEEENVFHLCDHSKKLAIAFELINTAPFNPLQTLLKFRFVKIATLPQSSSPK